MYIASTIVFLFPVISALVSPSPRQHIFTNPPSSLHTNSIPTSRQSAILARRILALTPLGTLSTIFPSPHASEDVLENRPPNLSGLSIGLMDYIADCEIPGTGNPTILAINIATTFKNVAAGSNISLSMRWTPLYPPSERISWSSLFPWRVKDRKKINLSYSAANLPRFSLLGYLENIPQDEVESNDLRTCFTKTHPDARYWLPGNSIHESEWVRLVVQQVYWIGGFGDRAYIGWIPVEEWRNVTREDWKDVRLPGEKRGWKEWSGVDPEL